MGRAYAYRLLLEPSRVPDALEALASLAAPDPDASCLLRLPSGRELRLPFAGKDRAWDPASEMLELDAVLLHPVDDALEEFLHDEPEALARARGSGAGPVGYVFIYAHPGADVAEPLAEIALAAAASSISQLFLDSAWLRGKLSALLETCGGRAGFLDYEVGWHSYFWLDGRMLDEPRGISPEAYMTLAELPEKLTRG